MNCLEARKCIDAYLNHRLDDETLRNFVKHIDECHECMEEFEINYMIYSGVRKLDDVDSDLNIIADFQKTLDRAKGRLMRLTALKVARCSVDTAVFWSVLVMLLMQIRIWMTGV